MKTENITVECRKNLGDYNSRSLTVTYSMDESDDINFAVAKTEWHLHYPERRTQYDQYKAIAEPDAATLAWIAKFEDAVERYK